MNDLSSHNSALHERIASTFPDLQGHIEQLLVLLSERERFVIRNRFALDDPEKLTLETIGQRFGVTRERVRQIEKSALQKLTRNIHNFDLFEVNTIAFELLTKGGELMAEEALLAQLLNETTGYSARALLFVLSLDQRFVHVPNTLQYRPYFRLNTFDEKLIHTTADRSLSFLERKGDIVALDVLWHEVGRDDLSTEGLRNFFSINKNFKLVDDSVGLITWKHIHPRTLRDKIYFILRKQKQPKHFLDIANSITEEKFDAKTVNLQAVHNELIRYNDFVLIGRGIYALREWGYTVGTVAQIIERLLKKEKELSEDEIVDHVLKQRQVKPLTVILNLKNKPQFIRTGRKVYTLRK